MTAKNDAPPPAHSHGTGPAPAIGRRVSSGFGFCLAGLLVGFAWPLYELAALSVQSDLYSHMILIPLVSGYLFWRQRPVAPSGAAPDHRLAFGFLGAGLAALGAYFALRLGPVAPAPVDALALRIFAFLLLFVGVCAWFVDRATLRASAFPLGFLVFMVPFPAVATSAIETFFQHTSAAFAHGLFKLAGTPVYYQDLTFRLPGINLEVAPECSGIRSSLALFITSIVAGRLFLRSPWKRAVLAAAIVPLAFMRNGFRIFTIGELCVHVSPDMINSYIHRHGGPLFFALSLIPFFLLLRFLYQSDHPRPGPIPPKPGS